MAKNSQKSLSEVFKELEQNKNKQIENYIAKQKNNEEQEFVDYIKNRTKVDNIKLILIVVIILLIFSLFSKNYIFAKDSKINNEKPKEAIAEFEENKDAIDVYGIISENISVTYQKEIFDRDEEIEFETEYINNKDIPKDEQLVKQEGKNGSKTVTYVTSYENGEIIDESSIGEVIKQNPQKKIVEIGTSEVLKTYNIHIGDKLYVVQNVNVHKETDINSIGLISVPRYFDVEVLEIIEDSWIKVKYKEVQGYILCDFLTSETLSPTILELSRKAKILNKVKVSMPLNKPSSLTEEDFNKILGSQARDVNNIFKDNYKAFYEVEQKYNINGVFVAAIGIHESNWGTSRIASDKKNLFGFGAYDWSPYESAVTFETYANGIDTVANWLSKNYVNASGTILPNGEIANGKYYNGPTVSGVNKKYASDTNWANRVFTIMKEIYSKL